MAELELVDTFEIERDFGIPRLRVSRMLARGDFPRPVHEGRGTSSRIWRRADVKRHVDRMKREGRL